jgi:citrate lyase subunit beta/citryl-CoA lyase
MKKLQSYLMVAGDKEKHLSKINELSCDVAVVNLEDGVFDKVAALELLSNRFSLNGFRTTNKYIVVRINPIEETGYDEIIELNKLKPHAIRIPKIKTIDDVQKAIDLIDEDIEVHLSIETKEAFHNLSKLRLDKRITTVYLGILDLLESLELPQNLLKPENPMIEYILSRFLVESKIVGFKPIFLTYQEYKNTEEFTKWIEKAKLMGYTASSCISPTQAQIVNQILSEDEKEIEKAKYIVKIFEENRINGITGFVDEKFGFVDEPIYKNAKQILKNI